MLYTNRTPYCAILLKINIKFDQIYFYKLKIYVYYNSECIIICKNDLIKYVFYFNGNALWCFANVHNLEVGFVVYQDKLT